jgi:Uma2 family endonuclease
MASSSSMRRRANAVAAPRLMTVDEYFRTPETVRPMELAFGVLRVAESPTPRHQAAVAELFLALNAHVEERDLGRVWLSPLDVVFDRQRALVVQPDLFFISRDREWIVGDRIQGAPDLVIEVLSPNPRIGTTTERVGWFAEYGVRECWLLHQDRRTLTVLEFADRRTRQERDFDGREPIRSAVLPDFSLTLDDVLRSG